MQHMVEAAGDEVIAAFRKTPDKEIENRDVVEYCP